MKRIAVLVCAVAVALTGTAQVTNGIWQGTSTFWSDSDNWVDGDIAFGGGSAAFTTTFGGKSPVTNDIPDLLVGSLAFSNVNWTVHSPTPIDFAGTRDDTNTIHVNSGVTTFDFTIGDGVSTLHKTGGGYINLTATDSLFNGRWVISQDRIEIKTGTSLMAEPAELVPDAITLDGADIKNNDSTVVFPPNMGITLSERGGVFGIGWSEDYRIILGSPITGPGQLRIARNNGIIILANPTNDYAGGTLVGVNTSSGYAASDSNVAHLRLAADGVLPYGILTVNGTNRGILDIAGNSNRVTTLTVTSGGILTNSVPGTGMLIADGGSLAGRLSPGTRVIWTGAAPLALAMTDGDGGGTIDVTGCTLTNSLALGGAELLLDGATLTLGLPVLPSGESPLTTNRGLLRIGANGGAFALASGNAATTVSLTGGIVSPVGTALTLPAGLTLTVGSAGASPAYFDADIAGDVIFRDRVWVNRLPASWTAAPGATMFLSSENAAADYQAVLDAGAALGITTQNAAALLAAFAPTGITAPVWLDTVTLANEQTHDSPANALTLPDGIALAGGTLGITGAGTVTLGGTLSGSGSLVKTGNGTAILNGANTFAGAVTVNGGILALGSDTALGDAANPVTLAGGTLANTQGADVTLANAVTVAAGSGFTVNGGSLHLTGALTLADGTLNKQGDGELIINATSLPATCSLNLTGGAVVYLIDPGTTAELASLRGSGDLILRGGGALTVTADAAYTGRIVMENGILLNDDAPAEAPALWLDASDLASLHFDDAGGITRWNDTRDGASGTAHPYAYLNKQAPNYGSTPGVPHSNGTFQNANAPTLLPNEIAGKPVVDFGKYLSGSWLEVTPVENTRTIFWVLGSQNGGGHLIGTLHQGTARGGGTDSISAGAALWNGSDWNGETFRGSTNWINGVGVVGTSKGLSGGYDQITTILPPPSNIIIRALAKEGRLISAVNDSSRSGGQRLAELIIYTRELTEPQRLATETYLRHKWQAGAANTTPALHVTDRGTVSLPLAGTSLTVPQLTGNGTLTKDGAGTLVVENTHGFNGTLSLAEGAFTADGYAATLTANAATTNPVPGAAFWVDATVPGTFGTDANGIPYWRDARWDGITDYIVATQRWEIAPTVISNAVGLLPVINIGPTNTIAGMQWSRDLTNVRTVFWLIGSQEGGGILLGGNDGTSNFNRYTDNAPPSTPIYSNSGTHSNIRNGITRIDGIPVNGATTGLNGHYQVIALRTTGNILAGQFAHDRVQSSTDRRHGGQRLGEVIVYTNALTDAEMLAVEAYLMAKWQRPGTRSFTAALAHVDAPTEGQPPATGTFAADSRLLNVGELTGSGLLSKTGDATLMLGDFSAYTGQLTLEGGRTILNGAVPRNPAFWVDASRTDTVTYDPLTRDVTRWDDCRFNDMYAEFRVITSKGKGEFPPTFLPDDLNGLPVIDLGEWMSNKHLSWSQPLTHIRTVFWVFGSQAGGGLLLSYDRDTTTRNFYRAGGGVNEADLLDITHSNPIWTTRHQTGQPQVNSGQTRLNSVTINGQTTGLSGGYDVISVRTTGDASASSFGNDRQRPDRDATGGQRLAEVIVYEEALTDDEIRQVEAYLHAKWGVATAATATDADFSTTPTVSQLCLMLRSGATLELGGTGHHTISALGGTGAITDGTLTTSGLRQAAAEQPGDALRLAGSLTLASGADWTVEADPDDIAPVIAAGPVTFQGGGTLTLTGAAALPNAPVLLLQGASVTGFNPAAWSVVSDNAARQYSLHVIGNTVYLQPSAKGTLFMLQ